MGPRPHGTHAAGDRQLRLRRAQASACRGLVQVASGKSALTIAEIPPERRAIQTRVAFTAPARSLAIGIVILSHDWKTARCQSVPVVTCLRPVRRHHRGRERMFALHRAESVVEEAGRVERLSKFFKGPYTRVILALEILGKLLIRAILRDAFMPWQWQARVAPNSRRNNDYDRARRLL